MNRAILISGLVTTLAFAACEAPSSAEKSITRAGDVARPIGDLVWLGEGKPVEKVEASKGSPRVPDSKIKYDVEALLTHADMRGARIDVHVLDQNVTLQGSAPTGTQADWAEVAARSVHGILALSNRIQISP